MVSVKKVLTKNTITIATKTKLTGVLFYAYHVYLSLLTTYKALKFTTDKQKNAIPLYK